MPTLRSNRALSREARRLLPRLMLASLLATAPGTAAADSAPPSARPALDLGGADAGRFHLHLLPKSLQKHPPLDMTVMTDVTRAGKSLAEVSQDHPAYYVARSGGFHQFGDGVSGEMTLAADDMERVLAKSLAASGYLPAASPAVRPSLLIVYTWGSHNQADYLDWFSFFEAGNLLPVNWGEKSRLRRERALLVGGIQLAQGRSADPYGWRFGFLNDQADADLYFVVASAYDYNAAAQNQKVLLWRTRMTVSSEGVSQPQTLPGLVMSAAPYFGREMPEPAIFNEQHIGHVEIGPLKVVRLDDTKPDTAAIHEAADRSHSQMAGRSFIRPDAEAAREAAERLHLAAQAKSP